MFFFRPALTVSRRPLIAEAKVRSQASPREIYGGKIGNETGFSPSTSAFLCRYHFTNAPYPFFTICCSDQMNQWAKPGNIPITHTFGNRGALYRKSLLLLSLKYHYHYSSSELQGSVTVSLLATYVYWKMPVSNLQDTVPWKENKYAIIDNATPV
jgi:hypothetical protein